MTGRSEERFNEALRYYNDSYDLDRIEKSLPIFKELAKQGHAGGLYYLGLLYKTGHGVGKNRSKALVLYNKAAENGYAEAQYKIGAYYYFGWDITDVAGEKNIGPDQNKGLEWWRKAAEQGHENAQDQLYKLGVSTSIMSKSEQKDIYKKAEKLFYDDNNNEAVPLFQILSRQGHAEAQYQLANCYQEGIGVDEDKAKAAELWIKAAEQGHGMAQAEAGRCCYFGVGVKEDQTAGVNWWHKAAKQENGIAQMYLDKKKNGEI